MLYTTRSCLNIYTYLELCERVGNNCEQVWVGVPGGKELVYSGRHWEPI